MCKGLHSVYNLYYKGCTVCAKGAQCVQGLHGMYKGWAGVVLCCAVEDLRLIVIFFHYTGATVSCRLGYKYCDILSLYWHHWSQVVQCSLRCVAHMYAVCNVMTKCNQRQSIAQIHYITLQIQLHFKLSRDYCSILPVQCNVRQCNGLRGLGQYSLITQQMRPLSQVPTTSSFSKIEICVVAKFKKVSYVPEIFCGN